MPEVSALIYTQIEPRQAQTRRGVWGRSAPVCVRGGPLCLHTEAQADKAHCGMSVLIGPGSTHTTTFRGQRYWFSLHNVQGRHFREWVGGECYRYVASKKALPLGDDTDGFAASCWVQEKVFYWARHTHGLPCYLPLTNGRVAFAVERRNTHTGEVHMDHATHHDTTNLLCMLMSQQSVC